MKVKPSSYVYDPRISLYLIPETEVERELLKSLWKHGRLEVTNGVVDGSGQGFGIVVKREEALEKT